MTVGRLCRWLACGVAITVPACGVHMTDPPDGFPVAWMVNGCSPVDGTAIVLYLGETVPVDVTHPPYPHLSIGIDAVVEGLSGKSFTLQGSPTPVFVAQRCVDSNNCISATDVNVEFDTTEDPTQEHTGFLRMTFPDGSTIAGSFRAAVHHLLVLCG